MVASDPFSGVLAALATAAVLGLLVLLYREHPEPFLGWSLVAWGARLTGQVIALGPALGDTALIWTAAATLTATVKGLAFLGG